MLDPRRPRLAPWLWWAGFGAFAIVTMILTALAYREGLPELVRRNDKATHFVLAGCLVFFLDGLLQRRSIPLGGKIVLSVAWVAVLLPAGVEEYLQRYATFRTSELGDWLADVAGATTFLWLSRRVDRP
jgi:VanZ family protein